MSDKPAASRRDALVAIARSGMLGGALLVALTGCKTPAQRRVKALGGSLGEPIPQDPRLIRRAWSPGATADLPAATPSSRDVRVGIIPRSRWTTGAPRPWLADPMGSIQRITVHHDAIDPMPTSGPGEVARRLDSIRRSHLRRGWADIGYHFAVDPAGRVWEGRPLSLQGAHVADQNQQNLGIVMLGNFEHQIPTPSAVEALDRLIASEMRRYRISISEVRTHLEMAPTACPGRHLQRQMDRTRTRGGRLASLVQGDYRG